MITKTTYILNHEELREALETWLNRNEDEQDGDFTALDIMHGIDVVKSDDGTITAVQFHTESTDEEG